KTGLKELISSLEKVLQQKPARQDLNRPRLPIDRVFSMSGFGTVVTGTLSDGHLSIGEEVEILPQGLKGRIRGLQTHKRKEERAVPGSRTAVNISGVDTELIRRGEVVAHPNQYQPTRRMDARLRLLKDVTASIKHGDEVKFFVGASETIATLRLLGTEELHAGEEAWIQFELRDPLVAVRGDRYILRRPSPSETLGGGTVIDHQPRGRHKRFDENVLQSLASLAQGSPAEVLFEAALSFHIAPLKEIVSKSRLDAPVAETALQELLESGKLIVLENGEQNTNSDSLAIAIPHLNELQERIFQFVEANHAQYPLRRGIPREELKSKLKLTAKIFNTVISLLVARQTILDLRGAVSKPGHEIEFTGQEQAKIRELMRNFEKSPYATP
ncbi:MAG: DNA/RNA-binding winged helix domain-containing protein, partial [Legionella sp.]|nr:DNA/RNA-binding winged helix domain-containing protein [Legionella sp.]